MPGALPAPPPRWGPPPCASPRLISPRDRMDGLDHPIVPLGPPPYLPNNPRLFPPQQKHPHAGMPPSLTGGLHVLTSPAREGCLRHCTPPKKIFFCFFFSLGGTSCTAHMAARARRRGRAAQPDGPDRVCCAAASPSDPSTHPSLCGFRSVRRTSEREGGSSGAARVALLPCSSRCPAAALHVAGGHRGWACVIFPVSFFFSLPFLALSF